jgi:hypothetical protein
MGLSLEFIAKCALPLKARGNDWQQSFLFVHACMMEESQGKHPFKMEKGMTYYCPCLCIKKNEILYIIHLHMNVVHQLALGGDWREGKKGQFCNCVLFVKGRLSIDGLRVLRIYSHF